MMPQGSVHGRFQPFHNEHLEYVVAAEKKCDFLWIGITKYDLDTETSPLGRERERPENNPLTYIERISIIGDALRDVGIPPQKFAFVPFPIEHPQKLKQFLSTDVICYTTICEEWNREKIGVLQAEGYHVSVLWERTKTIAGYQVREQIAAGQSEWRNCVPHATARAIDKLNLRERLLKLRDHGS